MNIYSKIGLAAPEILLPDDGTDMTKWAVIACDQYTSEPDYWTNAEEIVGDAPSTLRLILPEYYLPVETEEQKAKRARQAKLDEMMKKVNSRYGDGTLKKGNKKGNKPDDH